MKRLAPTLAIVALLGVGSASAQDNPGPAPPSSPPLGAPSGDQTEARAAAEVQRERALALAEEGRAAEAADAFLAAAELFGRAADEVEQVKCLHNGAAMLSASGRHEQAVAAFTEALTTSVRLGLADHAASSALGRGLDLGSLGREEEAAQSFEFAAALFEELGDRSQLAMALYNRAVSLGNLERAGAAAEVYARAQALYRDLGDPAGEAWAAAGVGLSLRYDEHPGEALVAIEHALALTQRLDDTSDLGWLHHERGILLVLLNRWHEALDALDMAEPLLAERGERAELARLAYDRGQALMSIGRYAESLDAYALAEQRMAAGDGELAADVLRGRGELLCLVGRFSEGLERYAEAAALLESHRKSYGRNRRLGALAGRRGEAARSLGHFGEALAFLVEAEGHFERAGREGLVATAILDRAELYAELGRTDDALAAYDEAQVLFALVDEQEWLARVDLSRATTLRKAGDAERAWAALERARPILEALGNRPLSATWSFERASLLLERGRPEESLTALAAVADEFLALGGEGAVAHLSLARAAAHHALGHTDEALAAFDRAEAIWEELGLLQHLVRVSAQRGQLLAEQGRHAEALASLDTAARRLDALLAGHVAALGESSLSSLRVAFAPVLPIVLDSVASLPAAAAGDLGLAWHVLEVFQGLGMAQLVAEGRRRLDALPVDVSIGLAVARQGVHEAVQQLVDAQEQQRPTSEAAGRAVAAARALLDARQREFTRVRDAARAQAPLGETVAALPPLASIDQVAAALGPGEALVHFAALGERAYALVVSPSGPRLVSLGATARVDAGVDAVARRLDPGLRREEPVPAELIADLRGLGRLVLDPILAALADEAPRRLLVVPSGSLCRVPLEALLTADVEEHAAPATWPFLVADVAVAYAHSGTTWLALRRRAEDRAARDRSRDGPQYVALAHPVYEGPAGAGGAGGALLAALRGGRDLAPLPRTADEVLAVARLLAQSDENQATLDRLADELLAGSLEPRGPVEGEEFLLLLREQATEGALKASAEVRTARVLHLACHGAADTRSPALSRLVLGRSPGEDGRLFVDELAELHLGCELLVLSACETNAGPVRPLEGVDGLSRAGLAAGAVAVLSTLWQVQDEGARRLIVAFHRAWLGEGRSRISALAGAKRAAIRDGLPVATWSAFQLWDGVTGD